VTAQELVQNKEFRALCRLHSSTYLSNQFGCGRTTILKARHIIEATESAGQRTPADLSDKAVNEFCWRDANRVIQDVQSLAKSASQSQDTARIDFSHLTEPMLVIPISDWHFGSYGSDYKTIEEDTDLILQTPGLYTCIIGDMLQMAIKMRNVLEMMDNALTPKLQIRYLESWLKEIEHKVLFSTWDNHAVMREEAVTGISHYAEIFSRRVIWFNGIGEPDILVGGETYRLVVSHRFRGNSILNPVHAQMRYLRMEGNDRELAIQGDTHVPGYMQYVEGGHVRTVINCGSHQTNSGFAKRHFSVKTWQVFPCFALHHDEHKIVPFWSVKDMLRAYKKA
jgi:hypothetical protein